MLRGASSCSVLATDPARDSAARRRRRPGHRVLHHVCAALSDNGFRRLRSFRPDGPACFKTWLMAVVSNLCVDWHRQQQGRIRPTPCILHLPELDQQVYQCIYVRRMSRAQCLQELMPGSQS